LFIKIEHMKDILMHSPLHSYCKYPDTHTHTHMHTHTHQHTHPHIYTDTQTHTVLRIGSGICHPDVHTQDERLQQGTKRRLCVCVCVYMLTVDVALAREGPNRCARHV